MAKVKCKCGESEVNFQHLSVKDVVGFEAECCVNAKPKKTPQIPAEVEAPAQETLPESAPIELSTAPEGEIEKETPAQRKKREKAETKAKAAQSVQE